MVTNPNWQEANQLAFYKHGREIELGTTEKQIKLAARMKHGTRDRRIAQVRYANHSSTLPLVERQLFSLISQH